MLTCRVLLVLMIPTLGALALPAAADPGPPPPGYTLSRVSDAIAATFLSGMSQFAFKPGDPGHLFAARSSAGAITRYDIDPTTGALTNAVNVAAGLSNPYGLAFRGNDLYVSLNPANDSRITRLRDLNADGIYEERSDFVRGVPNKDHGIDQLQITGATLFASIGTKTNSARPDCETPYTGTIGRIADLDQIDYAGGGNYLPDTTTFRDSAPADGLLRRYASGLRNPFGLRLDAGGNVWVSDNGASHHTTGSSCNIFAIDTPDLLYRGVPEGARGGFPPPGYPGAVAATMSPFATLATHAAVTGFAWIPNGPDAGHILLTEYGATDTTLAAGRDVQIIDPVTGAASMFISGLSGPTDIIADTHGRLFIADYAKPAIYLLTPPGVLGVDRASVAAPPGARLERIVPNPSAGSVTIDYMLAAPSAVTLRILDIAGREVARMSDGVRPAGSHTVHWSPRTGATAPRPGIYLCRLETRYGTVVRAFVRAQ